MWQIFYNTFISSPFFGIWLSIIAFYIGILISRTVKSPFANPLLIAMIICITVLKLCNISYETYSLGGDIIYMFLGPATTLLAVSVYNRFETLKKNLIPILAGTIVGSVVSVSSIIIMCRLFALDDSVSASLFPKSVTTAIAFPLAELGGGITAITFAATTITGILGAVGSPFLAKIFFIKNPVAVGLAIGTSSHALGTTKAIQMGETQAAMSSIAIALAGIVTVLLYAIFPIL
ncbi:MAG: LrgB family protein [Spirochaetales bacterium]